MTARPLFQGSSVRDIIRCALREDIGKGDITSNALVPGNLKARAVIIARGSCVVSGTGIARRVFKAVDGSLECRIRVPDGKSVRKNQPIMEIRGRMRSLLTAERTALNFMQRMTGIATLTARFVRLVKPYGAVILDTRKTTPTLRRLEKYAVVCGGGRNHRMGLYDMVLIKDNHRRLCAMKGRGLDAVVAEAKRKNPRVAIEVEVESESELRQALKAGPDWVLLDNMTPARMKRCVALCRGRCRTEASGGINLANIRAAAATGVDAISLGCLTHSAPAADLSLEISPAKS